MKKTTPELGGQTTVEMTVRWLRDTMLSRQMGTPVKVKSYQARDTGKQRRGDAQRLNRIRRRRRRRKARLGEDLFITGSFACAALGGWCFTGVGNRTIMWLAAVVSSLKTLL